ncbi:MAG: FtsB family cell division protein [Chakrabartia sp.]
MKQARHLWNMLRTAATPALAFIVVAFFGGYALFGANGLLAGFEYRHQIEQRSQKLAELRREKAVIANRVALLDPKKANPDLVDELVRRELGLAHPDEIIIPLN